MEHSTLMAFVAILLATIVCLGSWIIVEVNKRSKTA
jgi:hypothetical protein